MKRIGLLLANPITNYGAHLQAFATQYAVDKLGVSSAVMDVSKIRAPRYATDIGFFVYTAKRLIHKVFKKPDNIVNDDVFINNIKNRTDLAIDFRRRRLHDEVVFYEYGELVNFAKRFDAIMIGSDQMWLPGTSFSPINSLMFVPQGVERISYATSLGVENYPRYCWHSARKMWNRMNSISVREQQGADIIKKVCGKKVNVQVNLDPTYLLTKEEWEVVIPRKEMMKEKYVFCYFLGNDSKSKLCAKRYAEKHHLQLVSILSCESSSDIDRTYADTTLGSITPEDFINWIRGAECVFTDSFHGLAFSVINKKQFFVFYRVRNDGIQSRNSRINNILRLWNCEDRLIVDTERNWDMCNETIIDYSIVDGILLTKREESISYLKRALKVNEN